MDLQLVFVEFVEGKRIRCERDVYKYLKERFFKTCYKVYSPVVKGMADFIVIELKQNELQPGFYEVKYNTLKLTEWQQKFLTNISKSFNAYVVVYWSKDKKLEFYKVMPNI